MSDQILLDQLHSTDPAQRQRALITLGKNGDRTALPLLADVLHNDPVPELRQLAGRAGRAIMQRHPTADPAPAPADSGPPPKKAAYQFNMALDLHVQGDYDLARAKMAQALKLHPPYGQDMRFRKLAADLMGTTPDEALQQLTDKKLRRTNAPPSTKARRSSWRTSPKKWRPIRLTFTIFSLVAIIVQIWWFVYSGWANQGFLMFRGWQTRRHVHELSNGQEYYVYVPSGSAPEKGWGVLVALHGYGGSGSDMLTLDLLDIAEGANAILIAPNFRTYGGASSENNPTLKKNLSDILDAVAEKYPVSSRGAVLYGFSQGGMFATSFLTGYSHRIYAIVADGAPGIVLPPDGTYLKPCHFVYGAYDDLKDFTRPNADHMRSIGWDITFETQPGAGHQMTSKGLAWVRKMVDELN